VLRLPQGAYALPQGGKEPWRGAVGEGKFPTPLDNLHLSVSAPLLGGIEPAGVQATQIAAALAVSVLAWLVARANACLRPAARLTIPAAAPFGSGVLSIPLPCLAELSPTDSLCQGGIRPVENSVHTRAAPLERTPLQATA